MNQNNLDKFCAVYSEKLTWFVTNKPELYAYSVTRIPDMIARMRVDIVTGCYGLGGPAIRATFKELGVKLTRTAIREYLNETKENKTV